jgi:choline dehydrogenase-like flavoprotein
VIYFVRRPNYKSQPEYFAPGHKSFIRLFDVLRHDELPDGQFRRHIRNIIGGFKDVRISLRRQLIELINRQQRISLRAMMEPRPMRDSRIMLSGRRDHFGMPRVRVDWKLHPKDKDGIVRVHTELQGEIERRRLGRLVVDLSENETGWPNSISGGKHHMGTTRMHRDPRKGVVDANCRVHGTTNLFIAGSSVFPTASFAHPTLTIVALAIRLADHLKSQMDC